MESSGQNLMASLSSRFIHDSEYTAIIQQAEEAIENGTLPKRIVAGSSGSYFMLNTEGVCSLACM
jgi:hypothetical protein